MAASTRCLGMRMKQWHDRRALAAISVGVLLVVLAFGWNRFGTDTERNASPDVHPAGPLLTSPHPSATHPSARRPARVRHTPRAEPASSFAQGVSDLAPKGYGPGSASSWGLTRYRVTISVSSPRPTALRLAYWMFGPHGPRKGGVQWGVRTSWSVSGIGYGSPSNAGILVQTGPDGVPLTCAVRIDGHVAAHKTTKGPYGTVGCVG